MRVGIVVLGADVGAEVRHHRAAHRTGLGTGLHSPATSAATTAVAVASAPALAARAGMAMAALITSPVLSRVAMPAAILAHKQSSNGVELSAMSRFKSVLHTASSALRASARFEASGVKTSVHTTRLTCLSNTR
jgi:hypothetical protein